MKTKIMTFFKSGRKNIRVFLAVLVAVAMVAGVLGPVKNIFASAATFTDTDTGITWYYEVDNGSAVKVYTTDNVSSILMLTIPESIEGYPVKSIGGGTSATPVAKSGGYTSVRLPKSIETINAYAFNGITSLKAVGITGTALKTIGNDAFNGCTTLASIQIDTVTSVGSNAFKGCTVMTSADFKACTSIGASAYEGCKALTTLKYSPYLTSIGNKAFKDCVALKKAYVPDTVTSFGTEVFSGDTALNTVQLDAAKDYAGAFVNCAALKNIIFGEKVTNVAKNAFTFTSAGTTSVKKDGMINYYFLNPKTKIALAQEASSVQKSNVIKNSVSLKSLTMSYDATGHFAKIKTSGGSTTATCTGNLTFDAKANTLKYVGKSTAQNHINLSGSAAYKTSVDAVTDESKDTRGNTGAIKSTGLQFNVDTDIVTVNKDSAHILMNGIVSTVNEFNGMNIGCSGTWYFADQTNSWSVSFQGGGAGGGDFIDHLITLKSTNKLITKNTLLNSITLSVPATISAGYGNFAGSSNSNPTFNHSLNTVNGNATATISLDTSILKDAFTYQNNTSSGLAGMNVYTKTGTFSNKSEVQTETFVYPETLDTNKASKNAATNGGNTEVAVKDISSVSVPYVADESCRKMTKISAEYGNAEAVGSEIDPSNVDITCYYNDGTTKKITGAEEGVTFTTKSIAQKDTNTFTVSYQGFNASFEVIGFEGKSLKAELNTTYLDQSDSTVTGWNAEKQAFETGAKLTKDMVTVKVVSAGNEKETTGFDFVNNEVTAIGDNEIVVVLSSDSTYKATVTVKGYNKKISEIFSDEELASGNILNLVSGKITEMQTTLDQKVQELQEKEEELTETKKELTDSEASRQEAETKLASTTAELTQSKNEIAELQEQMKEVRKVFNQYVDENDRVSEDAALSMENIKKQMAAFEQQASDAQKKADELSAFSADIRRALGLTDSATDAETLQKVNEIKNELAAKKEEVTKYEEALKSLKSQLSISGDSNASLTDEINKVTDKVQTTVKELESLQKQLDDVKKNNTSTGGTTTDSNLQKQIDSLQKELTTTKNNAASLTSLASTLKTKLGLSSTATEKDIIAKVDELLAKVTKLQTELEAAQKLAKDNAELPDSLKKTLGLSSTASTADITAKLKEQLKTITDLKNDLTEAKKSETALDNIKKNLGLSSNATSEDVEKKVNSVIDNVKNSSNSGNSSNGSSSNTSGSNSSSTKYDSEDDDRSSTSADNSSSSDNKSSYSSYSSSKKRTNGDDDSYDAVSTNADDTLDSDTLESNGADDLYADDDDSESGILPQTGTEEPETYRAFGVYLILFGVVIMTVGAFGYKRRFRNKKTASGKYNA